MKWRVVIFGGRHGLALVALLVVVTAIPSCTPSTESDTENGADELLAAAVAEAKLFGFRKAHGLAEKAMAQAEVGSDRWQWALYLSGLCAHQASPPTRALIARADERYRLLLETSPQSRYAPRATMNLGRIAELIDTYGDDPDLPAARRWYTRVIEQWPAAPIAGEATFRLAATFLHTFEEDDITTGIALLENWLAEHPDDVLASGMWQLLGDVYFYPRAEPARSLACYQRADDLGLLEKGREGPIYWRMATLADRLLDDRARAVTYYTRVIERTPAGGKAYEAQLALKRLGAPVPAIRLFDGTRTGERSAVD